MYAYFFYHLPEFYRVSISSYKNLLLGFYKPFSMAFVEVEKVREINM